MHHTPPVLRNVMYDEEESIFLEEIGEGIDIVWMEAS